MKTLFRSLITLFSIAITGILGTRSAVASTSLADLSTAEVISLLDAAPAKTAAEENVLRVEGADLIGKVYGVEDYRQGRATVMASALQKTNLTPQEDEGAYWLDSEDGYRLAYNGMSPQVSAMARFDSNDNVSDFGYFFVFPYTETDKRTVNSDQAAFCGDLLQEFNDMGLDIDVNEASEDLFEVVGDDNGNLINARLIDDSGESGSGRYILFLVVEPVE